MALVGSKIVWSDTTLNRWLTNPEALIPGQRMNFQVQSAEDRADLIAFLRRASRP
jgi:cytochrome c